MTISVGNIPDVSEKIVDHYYFLKDTAKWTNFYIFFTVKFRQDLWRKLELKLTHLLKSVAALPCEE